MLGGAIEQGLGNRLAHPPHSAVRKDAEGCDVGVVLDNFSILNSASSLFYLRILESLYIFRDNRRSKTPRALFSFRNCQLLMII